MKISMFVLIDDTFFRFEKEQIYSVFAWTHFLAFMEWADGIGSGPAAWSYVPVQSSSCSLHVFYRTLAVFVRSHIKPKYNNNYSDLVLIEEVVNRFWWLILVLFSGYDVPALNRYLDWIAIMTYDYHGQWDKKTGHVAPMYQHPEDDIDYFNMVGHW